MDAEAVVVLLEVAVGQSLLPVGNLTFRVVEGVCVDAAQAATLRPRSHARVIGVEDLAEPVRMPRCSRDTRLLPFPGGGVAASRADHVAVLDEEVVEKHLPGLDVLDVQFLEVQEGWDGQRSQRSKLCRTGEQEGVDAVLVVALQEVHLRVGRRLANLRQDADCVVDVVLQVRDALGVLVELGELVEVHRISHDEHVVGLEVAKESVGAPQGCSVSVWSVNVWDERRFFVFHFSFHCYPHWR